MISGNWDACQNLTCWLKYDIALCVSATLSHSMGCQQFRWPTNDPYRGNSWISAMSWLNICSSNAIMGKSFGILMGLRCKQKLEYSSDRYEKSLLKPKKNWWHSRVSFQSLNSVIKHTKFWHDLITKNWSSRKTKNRKEVFDSLDLLMWVF